MNLFLNFKVFELAGNTRLTGITSSFGTPVLNPAVHVGRNRHLVLVGEQNRCDNRFVKAHSQKWLLGVAFLLVQVDKSVFGVCPVVTWLLQCQDLVLRVCLESVGDELGLVLHLDYSDHVTVEHVEDLDGAIAGRTCRQSCVRLVETGSSDHAWLRTNLPLWALKKRTKSISLKLFFQNLTTPSMLVVITYSLFGVTRTV